jgi:hypothetical protein
VLSQDQIRRLVPLLASTGSTLPVGAFASFDISHVSRIGLLNYERFCMHMSKQAA